MRLNNKALIKNYGSSLYNFSQMEPLLCDGLVRWVSPCPRAWRNTEKNNNNKNDEDFCC